MSSPGLGATGSLFTEKDDKTPTVECEDYVSRIMTLLIDQSQSW